MRTLSHSGLGSRRDFPSWIRPAMKAAGITERPPNREKLGAGGAEHCAQYRQSDALRQALGADRRLDALEHLLGEAGLGAQRARRPPVRGPGGDLAAYRERKCRKSRSKSATPGASFHRPPPRTMLEQTKRNLLPASVPRAAKRFQ